MGWKGVTVGALISQLEKGSPRGKDTALQTDGFLQVLRTQAWSCGIAADLRCPLCVGAAARASLGKCVDHQEPAVCGKHPRLSVRVTGYVLIQ